MHTLTAKEDLDITITWYQVCVSTFVTTEVFDHVQWGEGTLHRTEQKQSSCENWNRKKLEILSKVVLLNLENDLAVHGEPTD